MPILLEQEFRVYYTRDNYEGAKLAIIQASACITSPSNGSEQARFQSYQYIAGTYSRSMYHCGDSLSEEGTK